MSDNKIKIENIWYIDNKLLFKIFIIRSDFVFKYVVSILSHKFKYLYETGKLEE